jgi:hypothetical protein
LIDENTAEDVPVTEFLINLTLHITATVDRGLEGDAMARKVLVTRREIASSASSVSR